MVTDALAQLSTVFRRRFLFNALLPTLVFVSLFAAVCASSFGSLIELSDWWSHLDILSKALWAIAYLATIWFLAGAVASQWRGIVRLFEGYPLTRLPRRRMPGFTWHSRQARRLWVGDHVAETLRSSGERSTDETDEGDEAEEGELYEPRQDLAYYRYRLIEHDGDEYDVLPTRLGNILLAAERYPLLHYGIDSIYFWPRLFPLLPKQFQSDYEKFQQQLEFPLVVAFLSSMTAWLGGLALLYAEATPELFLAWFAGGNLVAYLFYVLSITNAEELGEQQRTAFDLYRHLLLNQWPTPSDVRDERKAFGDITDFIVSNVDPQWGRPQQAHRRRHPVSPSN
ncbi:MAG TPA: hypothetical protein VLJ59_12435 [Mycobacteriales bacterium]|nr:hypothetical protein [Mycobacteriales bacterium]